MGGLTTAVAAALLAAAVLVGAISNGTGAAIAKGKPHAGTPAAGGAPVTAPKPAPQKTRPPKAGSRKQAGRSTGVGTPEAPKQAAAPTADKAKAVGSKTGEPKRQPSGARRAPASTPPPVSATTAPSSPALASSPAVAATPLRAPSAGPGRRATGSRGTQTGRRKTPRREARGTRSAPRAFAAQRPDAPGPLLAAVQRAGASGGERPGEPPARRSASTRARGDHQAGSPVTRTVRDIVEVVPDALKLALAGLLALSGILGGGYLIVAARARRLVRQRTHLLQDVGLLQTALLPPVPATVGATRTSVAYRPSDGPGAGGDFYDALALPGGRAAFILGDVSGHGRQALGQTAFIRYTLRAYLEAGLEPRLALQLAGPVIDEHLGGDFATVVLAVHDPQDASLTYACAGHPAPIVVGPTRPEPVLAASSPPIGLGMRTGLRQTKVPLPPGSLVCLYTDGLAEARTQSGILGRPRLADIVAELGRQATAPALLDRVATEARLVTDDMATVVLSPTAGVTAGGFREERLEVDLEELHDGLGERFLHACGVERAQVTPAVAEARAWAGAHGAVLLHVRFGVRGPMVEVLPRNVVSLEAASRRRALA